MLVTPEITPGRPSTPAALEGFQTPRIFLVTVKSGYNGRIGKVFAKVPYGGVYALAEQLSRSMLVGEVVWFRIEPAKPSQITKDIRDSLMRWPEALRSLTPVTKITWAV